jgi:hypothetical protein
MVQIIGAVGRFKIKKLPAMFQPKKRRPPHLTLKKKIGYPFSLQSKSNPIIIT